MALAQGETEGSAATGIEGLDDILDGLKNHNHRSKEEPLTLLPGVHESVFGAMRPSQVTLIDLALVADVAPKLSGVGRRGNKLMR